MTDRLTPAQVRTLREHLRDRCGLFPNDEKLPQVAEIASERMAALGLEDFAAYQRRLTEAANAWDELTRLAGALTVGETHFLRHPDHWKALERCLLPWILSDGAVSDRPIRLWSAGCSSGEEAYTAAIVLQTALRGRARQGVEIVGTDISPLAIRAAEEAVYDGNSFRGVSDEIRERHFEFLEGGRYRPRPELRAWVRFEQMNLLDAGAATRLGKFDVVFCRNVLIYFGASARETMGRIFHESLRPGGYLVLGPAESTGGAGPGFACVTACDSLFYRAYPRADGEHEQKQRLGLRGPASSPGRQAPRAVVSRAASHRSGAGNRQPARPAAAVTERERLVERRARALTHLLAEENAEAQPLFEEILERHPQDVESLLGLALLRAGGGTPEAALDLCERALALNPLSAEAYCVRGLLRAGLDDSSGAQGDLETAVSLDGGFSMARFHLACLYGSADRPDDAAREFGSALAALSSDEERRVKLHSGGFDKQALIRICQQRLGCESPPDTASPASEETRA